MSEEARLPVVVGCPNGTDPERALKAALKWADDTLRTACCPTHAVAAALLFGRQILKETAIESRVTFDETLSERLDESYCANFRVSEEVTLAHASAMLSAVAKVLLFGEREPRAPAVVGS